MKRFWDKVNKTDGCWVWTAARDTKGYGVFSLLGRTTLAHRVSYELCGGKIPDGLCVLHHCDNPPCVNPDHLFVGTQGDNMQDMHNKRRHPGFDDTHCLSGHARTKQNTYMWKGIRGCRICRTQNTRDSRARKIANVK